MKTGEMTLVLSMFFNCCLFGIVHSDVQSIDHSAPAPMDTSTNEFVCIFTCA